MVTPPTSFEATIPFASLRPLSRILVSLSKIGDELCFQATPTMVPLLHLLITQVILSTLNQSKSAFGMIKLDKRTFFSKFECLNGYNPGDIVVTCKMQIRVC